MRWHDWLILTTIGALAGGAFFVVRPQQITLSQGTYYVVSNLHYGLSVMIVTVGAALLHLLVLRRASDRVAAMGAIALVVVLLGLALTLHPQAVLGREALPRRYIDYPDAFRRWSTISAVGNSMAVSGLLSLAILSARVLLGRRRGK